jgi:hypothetical protein
MKKLMAVVAIISLMAVPAYATCGCQKKSMDVPKAEKKSASKGTQISAANKKAHMAAKAEKKEIKAADTTAKQ